MPMSRQHYQRFAEIFGSSKSVEEAQHKAEEYFARDNPNFSKGRFETAVEDVKVRGGRIQGRGYD